ncbi:UNVERIFIED_CONTAM: hypothetical protein K2H54_056664 [Gekko kuhli]
MPHHPNAEVVPRSLDPISIQLAPTQQQTDQQGKVISVLTDNTTAISYINCRVGDDIQETLSPSNRSVVMMPTEGNLLDSHVPDGSRTLKCTT